MVSRFTGLYQSETLTDVTLAAEGKHLQAHKMLLSACSDYFQSLFSINPCQHPIVILKDVTFEDLQIVVQFMYNGIVNVSSEKLPDILKVNHFLVSIDFVIVATLFFWEQIVLHPIVLRIPTLGTFNQYRPFYYQSEIMYVLKIELFFGLCTSTMRILLKKECTQSENVAKYRK